MNRQGLDCPNCHVPLRVKDRGLVGHTFPCPDCGQPLRIVDGGEAGFKLTAIAPQTHTASDPAAVKAPAASANKAKIARKQPQSESNAAGSRWRGKQLARRAAERAALVAAFFREPLVLVWTSAALFALVMLLVLAPWRDSKPVRRADTQSAPVADANEPPAIAQNNEPLANRAKRAPVEAVRPKLPEPIAAVGVDPMEVVARAPVDAARPPDVPAVDVPAAPKEAVLDIRAALGQPIVRYEQALAVPLGELLLELEELAAVPIFYDADRVAGLQGRLQQRVSFKAEQTTVGEIIRLALKQAEMDFEVKKDGIHLRLNSDAEPSNETEKPNPPPAGEET